MKEIRSNTTQHYLFPTAANNDDQVEEEVKYTVSSNAISCTASSSQSGKANNERCVMNKKIAHSLQEY